MLVEDGVQLDTRQAIPGDASCSIMHRSLAASLLWWLTALSVAEPVLDEAGPEAFGLILGPRTLFEIRAGGGVRRTRLSTILSGGLSRIEIMGSAGPEVRLRQEEPTKRWRFLDGNTWYLGRVGAAISPAVVVDPSATVELDNPLFLHGPVVLRAHTRDQDTVTYSDRRGVRRERRLPTPRLSEVPDALPKATFVPIQAEFGVTGLMRHGEWHDPGGLEAARVLLQARFDLRLGLWDLVDNSVLRQTLLEEHAVPPRPTAAANVSVSVARRAREDSAGVASEHTAKVEALAKATAQLATLVSAGWTRSPYGGLTLEVGERLRRYPNREDLEPLAVLWLLINKRSFKVILRSVFEDPEGVATLRMQEQELIEIAHPGTCDIHRTERVLWSETGGWGDAINWAARAESLLRRTNAWSTALRPYLDKCRRRQRQDNKPSPGNPAATLTFKTTIPPT